MDSFKIPSFQSGINEYYAEGLIKPYEAVTAINCDISTGSLKTCRNGAISYGYGANVHSFTGYYGKSSNYLVCGVGTVLQNQSGSNMYSISGSRLDFINFEYKGEKVLIGTSKDDTPFVHNGSSTRALKNRRLRYNADGSFKCYVDDNGAEHSSEDTIQTYAPKGDFVELHYDRLWITGNKDNPDRVYFSTAGVNGADIEDFTIPLAEEDEINQHGGFLDVRSYDGGKIIAMKVIFNSVVLFKNRTAYKIYGSSPSNYQLVDLFSCNGAIADKSIAVGNNGAYFLNSDGIYFYDGTNTNLVSQKIKSIISRMNMNYANKAVSIYKDNKYILAIPVDGSQENNMIIEFNTINNSFMTYNIDNVNYFVDYDNSILYSSANNVKTLFKGSTNLPLQWKTPWFDFNKKNTRKMSEYIYFRAKGSGSIKFILETERKTKELIMPLSSNEVLYRKKLKNKGRMFRLTIENINNSSFELIAPEIICEIDED